MTVRNNRSPLRHSRETPAAPERQPEAPNDDEAQPLGHEAPEIVADAATIGGKRLRRSALGDAVTALIGGMSVSFGAVAMAWASASLGGRAGASPAHLVGALAFPVGFIILLVGKSELFTENFLLPVIGVFERRGSLRELGQLWGGTLIANLIGVFVFALLISRPGVLAPAPARVLVDLAVSKVTTPLGTSFVQAIFAGWVMTLLTWLLLAAGSSGPRLAIIWAMGSLIILGEFNHTIISAAEIFMALLLGAPITVGDWLVRNFLPALVGNILGGVVFVTLLTYLQAHFDRQQTSP
ncbi:MAG TPA: formate/nitrite transporter family protein [Thermomicrobiales bacterium]|nr:formate/nitrite transporter family protein [Thermomicrobiales bacterium]